MAFQDFLRTDTRKPWLVGRAEALLIDDSVNIVNGVKPGNTLLPVPIYYTSVTMGFVCTRAAAQTINADVTFLRVGQRVTCSIPILDFTSTGGATDAIFSTSSIPSGFQPRTPVGKTFAAPIRVDGTDALGTVSAWGMVEIPQSTQQFGIYIGPNGGGFPTNATLHFGLVNSICVLTWECETPLPPF